MKNKTWHGRRTKKEEEKESVLITKIISFFDFLDERFDHRFFFENVDHVCYHHSYRSKTMAMEFEEHSEPYIEYFFRNKKTLETISINDYLRPNEEQHCLPRNDSRERDG